MFAAGIVRGSTEIDGAKRLISFLTSESVTAAIKKSGMAITIGRLRPDPNFDWRFVALSHNTVRGAAGGAILTAELLTADGYLTAR